MMHTYEVVMPSGKTYIFNVEITQGDEKDLSEKEYANRTQEVKRELRSVALKVKDRGAW